MQLFFTPVTILVATSAGFFIGFLWYSPALFLKHWLMGEGITKAELPKRSVLYMLQINLYSLVSHGAMATVLAILFDLLGVTTLKTAVSLGLLITFAFVVTSRFIDMVYTTKGKHYEKQSQIKFLVSSGYYLTVIGFMSAVLFLVAGK